MKILRDKKGKFIKGNQSGKMCKGITRSIEFKQNVSKFQAIRKRLPEERLKQPLSKRGSKNSMFKSKLWIGKKHKEESKIKMSCTKRKISLEKFNGFVSRSYKTGYYSQKYIQWRRDVFIRDEFTCRKCGKTHIYITAHHIKSFAKHPKLRFAISNGLTLCEDCHKLTDNYGGKNK